MGCPIRRSEDPRALAPPLGFSQRATSFIASRCQGIHQMPFSLSSPTPSPERARPEIRGRRSDNRPDLADPPRSPPSAPCDLRPGAKPKPSLRRGSRLGVRIPMPRPSQTERLDLLHGHDSLHDVQRTQDRDQRADPTVRQLISALNSRSPWQKTCQRPSDLCPLSSVLGTWWAWADSNGRPHAYQACALTS